LLQSDVKFIRRGRHYVTLLPQLVPGEGHWKHIALVPSLVSSHLSFTSQLILAFYSFYYLTFCCLSSHSAVAATDLKYFHVFCWFIRYNRLKGRDVNWLHLAIQV